MNVVGTQQDARRHVKMFRLGQSSKPPFLTQPPTIHPRERSAGHRPDAPMLRPELQRAADPVGNRRASGRCVRSQPARKRCG
jgi:hypothetical protein